MYVSCRWLCSMFVLLSPACQQKAERFVLILIGYSLLRPFSFLFFVEYIVIIDDDDDNDGVNAAAIMNCCLVLNSEG